MTRGLETPLSNNEEVTLRRVAHGQSDIAHLRAADLKRLRALKLIDGSPRVPSLTPAGKQRFDALTKPLAIAEFNAQNELLATLDRLTSRK